MPLSALITPSRSYIGQVATRCCVPAQGSFATAGVQTRSMHFARDKIAKLKVGWGNWHHAQVAGELVGTADATMKASIEYPAGVFHQLRWGGQTSVTISPGVTLATDWLPVTIPRGAQFWIRRSWVGGNPQYSDDGGEGGPEPQIGDGWQLTTSDLTLSGSITQATSFCAYPLFVVAATTRASLAILGDSRQSGLGDLSADTSGNSGEIAKALGGSYAYINFGLPSERAANFVTAGHFALRVAVARYCSHVIGAHGFNDIAVDATALSTVQGYHQTIAAMLSPRPYYIPTIPPASNGAWAAADGSDQTINGALITRVNAYNAWVRGNPLGIRPVEVADYVELAPRGSGKWKAPGYTTDGTHETTFANQQIVIAKEMFRLGGVGHLQANR